MAETGWVKRAAIAVPAAAALVSLGSQSVDLGMAGTVAQQCAREMNAWRAPPEIATRASVRDDLARAASRSPGDPTIRELLGILDARDSASQVFDGGRTHFEEALSRRPASSFTWANLVSTQYRLGDTGKQFEAALVHAVELGPFEPEVQRTVALVGLAVWDDVAPNTRRAVDRMVVAGMKRKPLEMLQIAERRGRLDIACGHLAGSPRRIGSKWAQICQSLEATS